MRLAFLILGLITFVLLGYGIFELLRAPQDVKVGIATGVAGQIHPVGKSLEERIRDAERRSQNVKGVYMTAAVANDQGRAATYLRENILKLIDETELDGVVIDVKETDGSEITPHLQSFLEQLRAKNIWTIARIATFRDNSQIAVHPEYYLTRADGRIWRDNKGNAWLDPASVGVHSYVADFSKSVADLGFDELQYDYIRFPSDGDVSKIIYQAFQASTTPKYDVLRDFFAFLDHEIKSYKPEIILSADLFGLVATGEDLGIGQRLIDVGEHFDYISLMLYPSHFYSGFYVPADGVRNLPAISLPYDSKIKAEITSANPALVVLRSLYAASDILSGLNGVTATSTAAISNSQFPLRAKLRPWLQDFDLDADTRRGIQYDAVAVRAQIDAAEAAGASGWLLWSPTNTYTEQALDR